jgi:ABC-type Fe3+-hydroxamate transport system substrate-binding protein
MTAAGRSSLANGGALAAALLLALAGGLDRSPRAGQAVELGEQTLTSVRRVRLPSGEEAVADASGRPVPLRPYRRIASTSMLTDRLLADLSEPDRVLAFSSAGAELSSSRWRFAGKPTVDGLGPLEAIIALKPDLVLMNASFGDGNNRIDKLRAAGIEVFNLGELHGVAACCSGAAPARATTTCSPTPAWSTPPPATTPTGRSIRPSRSWRSTPISS